MFVYVDFGSCNNPRACACVSGVPLLCDADRGWQALNGMCYKVRTDQKNFQQAQ